MKKQTIILCYLLMPSYCFTEGKLQHPTTATTSRPISQIESTFAMIKPDAIEAGHSGDIIKLVEQNRFEIKEMRKKTLTKKEAEEFYAEHKGKPFFNDLVSYITSGPVIGMTLIGENAIGNWRTLIGATDPAQANVGTLRKMFACNKSKNAVHGSDSSPSAQREIRLFFNNN